MLFSLMLTSQRTSTVFVEHSQRKDEDEFMLVNFDQENEMTFYRRGQTSHCAGTSLALCSIQINVLEDEDDGRHAILSPPKLPRLRVKSFDSLQQTTSFSHNYLSLPTIDSEL